SCSTLACELRNRKDTSHVLIPVWLGFRSPHEGLAASLLRTSEPPHWRQNSGSAARHKVPRSRSYFLTVLFFCSAASAADGWLAGSAVAFGASKAAPGLRG